VIQFRPGPDAARYLLAGDGKPVAFPFNVRWLLPSVCGSDVAAWWIVWGLSWPVLGVSVALWARGMDASWPVAVAAAVLVLALPGVMQPQSTWPVGVDLPAMAMSAASAACFVHGNWLLAFAFAVWAVGIKEQAPVWIALWVWSPWPLVVLPMALIAYFVRRPQIDPITATPLLRRVHDHPIRSAFEHRAQAGGWRNFWLMVAPWSVGVAALLEPSWQLVAALAVGYAALLVATDTVRVYQPPAAPVVALAACSVIPERWLPLALLPAVFFWRPPVTG
jgi:hypothetical protein